MAKSSCDKDRKREQRKDINMDAYRKKRNLFSFLKTVEKEKEKLKKDS